jgi:hypothetical protein
VFGKLSDFVWNIEQLFVQIFSGADFSEVRFTAAWKHILPRRGSSFPHEKG